MNESALEPRKQVCGDSFLHLMNQLERSCTRRKAQECPLYNNYSLESLQFQNTESCPAWVFSPLAPSLRRLVTRRPPTSFFPLYWIKQSVVYSHVPFGSRKQLCFPFTGQGATQVASCLSLGVERFEFVFCEDPILDSVWSQSVFCGWRRHIY